MWSLCLFVQIRCVFMFWFKFWFWNSFLYILFWVLLLHKYMEFGDQSVKDPKCGIFNTTFFFCCIAWLNRILLIVPQQQVESRPTAVKMLRPNHWTAREIPLILHLNVYSYSFILILFIEAIPAHFQKLKHISHKVNRSNQCQLFGI